MLPDLGLTDKITYDGDECLRLYKLTKDNTDPAVMDDYIRYLKRHVIMTVRRKYLRRTRRDVCEDLIQAVIIELWQISAKYKIPDGSTAVFHSFINQVMRCRIAKTFKEVYDDAPKYMDSEMYKAECFARIPAEGELENSLFRQELPVALIERVMAEMRFPQENIQGASRLILEEAILHREPVPDARLKREFDIRDPKWLKEHLEILCKNEMYKMREEIKFPTNEEKRTVLHEGAEDCFSVGE